MNRIKIHLPKMRNGLKIKIWVIIKSHLFLKRTALVFEFIESYKCVTLPYSFKIVLTVIFLKRRLDGASLARLRLKPCGAFSLNALPDDFQ